MSVRAVATPLVTVCVPAYKSADFIGHTLESIAGQTMPDFRVLIAIEPEGAEETVAVLGDFLADGRFDYYVNKTNHGYALNVRALFARVTTPYYAVLPHDDLWHPEYLELLLGALSARPDASAAHGDWFIFGRYPGIHSQTVTDGPIFDRVLTWFLDGAFGWAWHGLMRSTTLDKPFPNNAFDGFAVEGDWSLHLLLHGPVLYEPSALFLKREQPADSETAVSVGWLNRNPEKWLRGALELHRRAMLEPLATIDLPRTQLRVLELAAEAAMIGRVVMFYNGRYRLNLAQEQRAADTLAELHADGSAPALEILGRLHMAVSRNALRTGSRDVGLQHAEAAVACSPEFGEAQLHLANAYLALGRPTDALTPMRMAVRLNQRIPPLAMVNAEAARQLTRRGVRPAGT